MPASVKQAILPVVVALLALFSAYFKSDAKTIADAGYALSTAITGLIIAAWIWLDGRKKNKKIERVEQKNQVAEAVLPGVSSVPKGSVTSATLTINDPTTPDPPVTITNDNPRTP